jgi:hypothetical protein
MVALLAFATLLHAAPADARRSAKKAIWGPFNEAGPLNPEGQSLFPIYRDLGVGIYETQIRWDLIAPTRPASPRDPLDPAYQWPLDIDAAIAEAARHGIHVAIQLFGAPGWANGNRSREWAPNDPADFAAFAAAAAARYPTVRLWLIWGEPSRATNFKPLVRERRRQPLTGRRAEAPRRYARMVDRAYVALKGASPRNRVIAGNTFTTGDVSPLNWIRAMRLRNGLPPRMDMYGHNPFSIRAPNLSKPPGDSGFADFSDLDTLAGWVDRYLSRGPGRKKGIRLFLSEFFVPTDHPNHEFNFYVDRKTQARWVTAALRITRRWSRIYAMGWLGLYDDAPRPTHDEVARGLIDTEGRRKPAYYAFRRG